MTDATWGALLDRFERDLDLPATAARPWATVGRPLPEDLADRAQRIRDRQRQRMDEVSAALDDLRQQIAALRRIPPIRGDAPALLDLDL